MDRQLIAQKALATSLCLADQRGTLTHSEATARRLAAASELALPQRACDQSAVRMRIRDIARARPQIGYQGSTSCFVGRGLVRESEAEPPRVSLRGAAGPHAGAAKQADEPASRSGAPVAQGDHGRHGTELRSRCSTKPRPGARPSVFRGLTSLGLCPLNVPFGVLSVSARTFTYPIRVRQPRSSLLCRVFRIRFVFWKACNGCPN